MEQNKIFTGDSYEDVINRTNAFLKKPGVHYVDKNIWQDRATDINGQHKCHYLLVYRYAPYVLRIGKIKLEFENHISKYLAIKVIDRMSGWLVHNNQIKNVWKKRAMHRHAILMPRHRYHRPNTMLRKPYQRLNFRHENRRW